MSKARARTPLEAPASDSISVVRTGLAAVLAVVGLAWVIYYSTAVRSDGTPTTIAKLGDWNFLIGFALLFIGLVIAAHPSTPLGRGRGVVVGMLGCFLVGLIWIVLYYVTNQDANLPIVKDLGNYNLLVGVGFMATGFVYATRWE